MKKLHQTLASIFLITGSLQAQPWIYDFGTATGTANNANSGSGNTSFFSSTPSGGGTYRVRIGTASGSLVLANPGTSLGTASETQLTAATSTSTNKFGVYDWTSPSTVAYVKAKVRTTSSGNGNLNFSLGINTAASDNQGYTSHYNNSLVSFTMAYTTGAISSVVRRISGSNTTIASSGFTKDTDQLIEVYANNGSGTASYSRNGTTVTLATKTWDLWVDGTKVVSNAATAGTLAASTNLSGFVFFAESSTSNAAAYYIDDIEYSNNLKKINTTGTLSALTTSYGTASSNTTFDVNAINLTADLTVAAPSGYEVSTSAGSGFASSINLTPSTGTVATTTIYVRLAASTGVGSYTGNVVCSSAGAVTVNVATISSDVNKADQTITFGALSNVPETEPDFDLTATASSGLTVTYASSNALVATVSGNTVTIVGVGSTNITASQIGDANYNAALDVIQSLTVDADARTPQTITFGALTNSTYGDIDFNLTATASSALPVTYVSSNTAVATISGSTVTIVAPGVTTITASQTGDGSFQPAPDVDQSLTVDAKTLTVSGTSADNKAYDRNTTATLSGATLVGIVGLDDVTVSGGGVFADANVADGIAVTPSLSLSGTDAAKYDLTQPTGLTANITAKDVTISGISAANKIYDNNDAGTLTGTASLSGIIPADISDVTLSADPTTTFASSSVANGISVSLNTNYTLSGSASGNYNLIQPSGLTADITAKELTISGLSTANKFYDATTNAVLNGSESLSGVIAADLADVSLTGSGTATFASANVSTGITVSVSGFSITGAASTNYSLTQPTFTADIDAKDITVSGASAADKSYDGTTSATISGGTLTGVETADLADVAIDVAGTFSQSNVGDGLSVTVFLTGSAAGNYNLIQPGITASITAVACSNQSVLWNFATSSPSSGAVSNLTVSALSQGNNNGTTTLVTAVSASSGYAGVSGTNNAGAACFTGALNTGSSTYFEFTLTPGAGYRIELNGLSFGSRSTSTGPQLLTLRSSLDSYAADIASSAALANSSWVLHTPTMTSVTSTTGSPITFRIYGSDGTGSPGVNAANWRIDDLNLSVRVLASLSSALTSASCDNSLFTYTPTSAASGLSYTWTRASVVGISNAAVTVDQTSNPSESLDNTTASPVDVVYSYKLISNNCFATQLVTVTMNPTPDADALSAVTACDSYTLPALSVGNYFTGSLGTGTPHVATDAITSTGLMYVYAETGTTPNCTNEKSFNITINTTPTPDALSAVTACDSYTLPALSVGDYYTGSLALGTPHVATDNITASGLMYIYAETGTSPNCVNETSFNITIYDCPKLNVSACGSTLTSLDQAIQTVVIAGATNYRYEVRVAYNNLFVGTSTRGSSDPTFRLTWLSAGVKYGTRYNIRVSAFVAGSWEPYGAICEVTTPATRLTPASCGLTLTTMGDALYSYAVQGAGNFRYEVRNAGDNSLVSVSTRNANDNLFRMSWVTGVVENKTYSIRVKAYTDGAWQNYGPACIVTTPISKTKLDVASCGATISSLADPLYSNPVPGAMNYRYKITAPGYSTVSTRGAPNNLLRLSWMAGTTTGVTYTIQAAIYVDGVWGAYGDPCTVTVNSAMQKQNDEPKEHKGELGFVVEENLNVYPNPSSGSFTISSTKAGVFNITNELGQVIQVVEITKENNYQTQVEGFAAGVYFVTGVTNNEATTKKVTVF